MFKTVLAIGTMLAYLTHPALAQPNMDCGAELSAAAHVDRIPVGLIQAIALVESGRLDPVTRQVAPWPWTINVEGQGHSYDTKQMAIQAVESYQAAGLRSIDVGCMQINLVHHPAAFATLDEAFDPRTNVAYGAHFLTALFHELGNWPGAVAAYHSRTEAIGADYAGRVMSRWTGVRLLPTVAAMRPASPDGPRPLDDLNRTQGLRRRLQEAAEDHRRILASIGMAPPGRLARAGRPLTRLAALR